MEEKALKPLLFRGVVWALDSFFQNQIPYIAAGFGSWLYLYKEQSPGKWLLVLKSQPFRDRDKIIEIRHYDSSTILLVASDRFKLCSFLNDDLSVLFSKSNLSDFILDVAIHEKKESYTLAFGHNFVQEYQNSVLTKSVACQDNSVIFCMKLSPFNSYVAAGTVFSQILVWNTASSKSAKVSARLKGHLGVIFRVTWINPYELVSVSDDRSVRLWRLEYSDNSYTGKYWQVWMKFGHNVRVWDAIYIKGPNSAIVATVSEDASCKTWDASNGRSIDHFRGHQGKNVWRVAGFANQTEATIITGGEDGSLKVWKSKFPAIQEEKQKEGVITHTLPMPSDQTLLQANTTLKNFKPLIKGVALTRDHRLLCSTNYGAIYEVNYTSEDISAKLIYHDPGFQNFTELLVWNEDKLLLSHSSGDCSLIQLRPASVLLQKWKCQQIRITNLYTLAGQFLLSTTGVGSFSLWKYNHQTSQFTLFCRCTLPLKSSVLGAWLEPQTMLLYCGSKTGKVYGFSIAASEAQSAPLVHCSQILLHKDRLHGFYQIKEEGIVVSFAKDSQIKVNKIDAPNKTLHTLSSIKVPLVNLIHQVFPTPGGFYVYGFDGAKLVLTNTSTCQEIFGIKCGGGHRPNEARVLSQSQFKVAYSKSNTLTLHFKESSANSQSYSITPSFHGREVLAALFYSVKGQKYLVTAGQDTLLQVHSIDLKNQSLQQIQVLNFHIGSVRCVAKVESTHQTFILSGGGRMVLNLFQVNAHALEHIQKFTLREDQDYRIMTISAYLQDEEEEHKEHTDQLLLIFLGTTSGHVLCFQYSFKLKQLEQIWEQFHGSTVLKVKLVKMSNQLGILATGLNNGQIIVHHITLKDGLICSELVKLPIHQMGVNGLEIRRLSKEDLAILSAADDQSLCLTHYSASSLKYERVDSVALAHHSAIKDLSLWGDNLVTCGYDQRLKLWKIEEGKLVLVDQLYTCLGDMNGSAMESGLVCLCGQGIEVLAYF